jgi:hypothetical protein
MGEDERKEDNTCKGLKARKSTRLREIRIEKGQDD